MRLILSIVVITALSAAAGAQQAKDGSALRTKPDELVLSAKPPADPAPAAGKEGKPARPVKKKSAEADLPEEEGSVMIDTKAEEYSRGRAYDNAPEAGEEAAAAGIPSSYGQLKGTLNEGGRVFLVFENDDGVVSLIQLVMSRDTASWKLFSRIQRSAD